MSIGKLFAILTIVIMVCSYISAQGEQWSEPEPLVQLNTIYSEIYPYLSTDGSYLLWNAEGTICMSRWENETWQPRELLPLPVNSEHLENAAAITPCNDWIYWVSWRPGGYGGWDIWRCSWDEDSNEFGEAECLSENINSSSDEFSISFSPDGNRIYFASNVWVKNGQYGFGDFDIWYCDLDSVSGDWGLPYNLGELINSTGKDYLPYISREGSLIGYVLYFSTGHSHGLPGWQGSIDILSIEWDGSEWINFQNIGSPVNSNVEERSPCVTQDGQTIYFSTRRDHLPNSDIELMVSFREPSVIDNNGLVPTQSTLYLDAYPNPFNSSCNIIVSQIPLFEHLTLKIKDVLGKEVKNLGTFHGTVKIELIWDGTNHQDSIVASGIYFIEALTQNNKQVIQISFLK